MGCRMLMAIGNLPVVNLLDAFRLMARNHNERHEHWGDREYIHGDGWGMVTGRTGRFDCYKNVMPCWQDPRFTDLCKADLDFIVLHARKASPGIPVQYEFTHPFEEDGWHFCHNGTVHDFKVNERSDAQQLFALLLENMTRYPSRTEAIRRTVGALKDYSALNFMLFRDDLVYVLNMYGGMGEKTPNYYTMKYSQASDYMVVSSERLPGCGREWKEMQNGTLLTLTMPDRNIEICRV